MDAGYQLHIVDVIAEGDRVAVWWANRGKPYPAGKGSRKSHIYRIPDGKIVDSINPAELTAGAANGITASVDIGRTVP